MRAVLRVCRGLLRKDNVLACRVWERNVAWARDLHTTLEVFPDRRGQDYCVQPNRDSVFARPQKNSCPTTPRRGDRKKARRVPTRKTKLFLPKTPTKAEGKKKGSGHAARKNMFVEGLPIQFSDASHAQFSFCFRLGRTTNQKQTWKPQSGAISYSER